MAPNAQKIKLIIHASLVWALYAWVFVLPWQTRWIFQENFFGDTFWEYASLSLYAHELLALLIIVLYALDRVVLPRKETIFASAKRFLQSRKVSVAHIGFFTFLLILLSSLWSLDSTVTLVRGAHIILALIVVGIMWELKISWQRIASILLGAGIIQGWLAVSQFLDQQVVASSWLGMAQQLPSIPGASVVLHGTERWLRAYGSLPHPNVLGGMLSIIFVLYALLVNQAEQTLSNITSRSAKSYRFALYGSQVFLCSGILLSFSRAAWLACLLGMVVIFFSTGKQKIFSWQVVKNIILIGLATTLVWVGLFPTPFLTRLQGSEPLEKQSIAERTLSYTDSTSITEQYALLGTGFGTYTHALIAKHPERTLSINQPVHNSWLLVLNELGIFGFVLVLALFVRSVGLSQNKKITLLFLAPMALLFIFDHWWVSLVFGNVFFALVCWLAQSVRE